MKNKTFKKYSWLVFYTAFALFSSFQASAQPKGAVCIINADQQIVVVDEILTGKTSLPAGTISVNESPRETAQREAWEETGLVVSVGKELGRNNKAVFFECVSDSDIIAFQSQSPQGGRVLPNWFAPHYGIEVSAARLIDPATLDVDDYRYPEQWGMVQSLFSQTAPQTVNYVNNLFDAASSHNQVELQWIVKLQSWVGNLSAKASRFVDSIVLTGLVFNSSGWLLLLLPLCYVYLPLLDRGSEVGFGLPNLTIALWSAGMTMLLKKLNVWGWNKASFVGALILVWASLALFYSGSAFIIDCLAGLLLGWLSAWHMMRLHRQIGQGSDQLFHQKGVWLLITGASGLMLLWWQTPTLLTIALSATVLLMLIMTARLPEQLEMRSAVILTMVLILTSMGLAAVHAEVDNSNLYALLVETARWPLLILISACYMVWNKTKA